ncbi:hypothetical protein N7495_007849 [Penicillium taxi]|uniref:uncharacterized protein n=1 Tax=Penicillium taxi TaxID=168475 RepID=UPI0025456969|nr:uncharacterized protein N7495_007849 [Penicillium taxi]KAJ5887808.1 hypothetical protein N7495_007849 [Penicillium taxi]
MSGWVALNVELDDGEDEVDDTKELQIEEALKLYTNALKIHSQGPNSFSHAGEAYDALFKSDIFKYPESISDFKQAEPSNVQSGGASEESVTDAIVEFNVNDSTSSLFQTLYLSHKNHGRYLLDVLQESLKDEPESTQKIHDASTRALGSFADALERDDTDLHLWRQSARLSGALKSFRLSRFCLESALVDDENRLESQSAHMGIEEMFSEESLLATLKSLGDELSASQVPVKKPKKALARYLKHHDDPFPYLPNLPGDLQNLSPSQGPLALSTSRREIYPSSPTWESVGKAIVQAFDEEEHASYAAAPSRSIRVILPHRDSEMSETASLKETDVADTAPDDNVVVQAENQDVEILADSSPQDVELENDATGSPKAAPESVEEQNAEKAPTESPQINSAQPNESHPADNDITHQEDEPKSPTEVRKRSSASAANEEQPENGRMKSRRTRARESNADGLVVPEEIAFDQEKYYGNCLEVYVHADEWMFNTLGSLLSRVSIEAPGSIESLREKLTTGMDSSDTPKDSETRLFQDLRGLVRTWNDGKSRAMVQKDDVSALKDIRGTSKSGLAVFLEHSRKTARKPLSHKELPSGEEMYHFTNTVNDGWLHPHDTSYEWIKCLLMPQFGEIVLDWPVMKSAYESFLWPGQLKETVVSLLVREDEFIFAKLCGSVENLERRMLSSSTPFEYHATDFYDLEMIQSIFELHLDVFAMVETLGSDASQNERIPQRDRLGRWSMLARSSLNHFFDFCPSEECQQNMSLRHLWATVFQMNLVGETEREHVLLCLQDLKHVIQTMGGPVTCLVNNSVMSELSTAAIDQEVLKLKCMDFFAKVFSSEDEKPVSLIEAIEPILEPSSIEYVEDSNMQNAPSHSSEMASFLDRGDATLRLFLWRRLYEAYQAIDYPPKVVCCYLRSIETVMSELEDAKHIEESSEHRQVTLLGWLKSLDVIMAKAIPLVLQQGEKAYECVDMDHLQASISAIARLVRLLHSFILYEDSVRVGQTSERDLRANHAKSLGNFKERMRELYVSCWIMLYTLLLEAISQNKDKFNEPLNDRIHVLRSVHHALGVRSMCKYSNKRFLKLVKSELSDLETKGDYETDVCQVLFDLYGIKFSSNDWISDHGCPPENLDQPTAITMIDFVIKQARKMNMKDLSKSELKTTIEKMQQAIGAAKLSSASPQLSFNRRLFLAYIKSPINSSNLLRAFQGAAAELPMVPVPGEKAKIASKGWFFLLGHATLTKFRSQKRTSPGSTSELDDAISFFRQDIDHGTGRWETWYRLAQVYDAKVDEDITWTADKINNNRPELATLQRFAIHCYAMAVSTAVRTIAPTAENREVLSDLYTDFGIRLYCSSREPLSMGAFSLEDFIRHFSHGDSQAMYKAQPFKEMPLYSVWGLASRLLRKAIAIGNKRKKWMTHYFLGKCLWKMLNCEDSLRTSSKNVETHDVLDALRDAILALPQRRDSRSEPIFEPHFKLLTVVQKLVAQGKMTPIDASKALLATPWARKVDSPKDSEGWTPYILEVIKKFKSADKSNWHHRMSAKAAHIIYDDEKNATTAAAAKHEMSQIFTKTLTIQVWRPEFERPGRHFVYTTRYVYFFASLLDQLDDRASLDQLLRRVKKKPGDFLDHIKLWGDLCLVFAKVTRRAGNIQEGHEESVFKPMSWDEFSSNTARLEGLAQLAPESLPILELLRDSVEMRKCNNNLMKVTMFEDLIADLYARVYELNMPLIIEQTNEENKEKMKVDHLLMAGDVTTEPSTPATPVPASDTPAPRGRTKGIARRDVQKRADNIVNLKLPRTAVGKSSAAAETENSASDRRDSTSAAALGQPSAPNETNNSISTADGSNGHSKISVVIEMDSDDGDEKPLTTSPLQNLSKNESAVETEDDDVGSGEEAADEGDGEDEEGANYYEAEGDGEDPNATEIENEDYDMPDVDDGATIDETVIDETIIDETIIDETIIDETDNDEEKAQDQLVGNDSGFSTTS